MNVSELYTVEQLIENIKRRCSVPTSQLTFLPQDFVDLANDELQGEVVPLIMSTREEFFVDYEDIQTPASGVIPLPAATVGMKVRSVCYVQQSSPLVLINLPRVDLDIVAGVGFSNFNTLTGFYIQGNDLVLYPSQSAPTNTPIRIYFYRRTLVLSNLGTYGQIISIDEMANTVVLSFVPYDWTVGHELNAINFQVPFECVNEDLEIVSVSSPTVELNSVEGLSVGDYVSDRGFSPIPQVPIEAHAYLAQLTAAKCLEALGDNEGNQAAIAKAEKLKDKLMVMISQRVDGSTKKIMNPNGGLRLGAGIGRFGWGRGGTW